MADINIQEVTNHINIETANGYNLEFNGPVVNMNVVLSNYYTKTETDALLNDKADKADTYTKSETNILLNDKADKADTYTISQINGMVQDINTAVDTKQNLITGAASTITDSNLTTNRAVISNGNGKVDVATTTTTELNYVHGVTSAIQTQLNAKASTALDNLSSVGQMIIDSANGTISNCILEIPQNIKLELSNNVLTLKAGSVLVKPASVYTTVTVANDVSSTILGAAQNGLYVQFAIATSSASLQGLISLNKIFSGTEFPTENLKDFTIFFNTNEYKFYYYRTNTSSWTEWNIAYPLCLIEIKSGVASFAKDSKGNDIIFNGWCYIGGSNNNTCSFIIYPNIKGLLPDGINSNGNLDSVNISRSALTIINQTANYDNLSINLLISNTVNIEVYSDIEYDNLSDITNPVDYNLYYIKSENRYYRYLSGDYIVRNVLPFIIFDKKSTGVTIKHVCQPYDGARYLLTDDLYKQIGDVETLLAAI